MSIRGIMRTCLWTQFYEAVRQDYGIRLPEQAGPEMKAIIDSIVDNIRMKDDNLFEQLLIKSLHDSIDFRDEKIKNLEEELAHGIK